MADRIPVKFSQVPPAPEVSATDLFIGIKRNEENTAYVNFNFSPAQLVAYILGEIRKEFVIAEEGNEFADEWMNDKEVQMIVTDGAAYQRDVHFGQTGGIITGTTISFYQNQKVLVSI